MDRYVVVRCQASRTLLLAQELYRDHGVEAWTPHFARKMRLPRGRPRRLVMKPILPGFVFIRMRFIEDAQALCDRRLVPPFRVFVVNGAVATVDVAELLRIQDPAFVEEHQEQAPEILLSFGDVVQISKGPFQGLIGKVVGVSVDYLEISCEKSIGRIKIPSWMVLKVPV